MLILTLLGMHFDAAMVFVKKTSLLFRLALATLSLGCLGSKTNPKLEFPHFVASKLTM